MSIGPPPLHDDVRKVLRTYRDEIPAVESIAELRLVPELRDHAATELTETVFDADGFLPIDELPDREDTVQYETVFPEQTIQMQYPLATNDDEIAQKIDRRVGKEKRGPGPIAVVSDITLYGAGGIPVTNDGKYLLGNSDSMPEHEACLVGAAVRDYETTGDTVDVDQYGAAITFTGFNPSNYYHWWIEYAPKLLAIMYYEKQFGTPPTILVPEKLPEWGETMFREFGYWEYVETWTGGVAHVDSFVVMPGGCQPYAHHIPEIIDWLRTVVMSRFGNDDSNNNAEHGRVDGGVSESRGKHIFISRGDDGSRVVENRDAVLDALPDTFEVYELAPMSFREQVQLFRDAEVIVAPHGAGLTNMVWATDATIVEITGEIPPGLYYDLAVVCGHSYAYVTCPETTVRDMIVDPTDVVEIVEIILRDKNQETIGVADTAFVPGVISKARTVSGKDTVHVPLGNTVAEAIRESVCGDALCFAGCEQLRVPAHDAAFREHLTRAVVRATGGCSECVSSASAFDQGEELQRASRSTLDESVVFEPPLTGTNSLPEQVTDVVGRVMTSQSALGSVLREVSLYGSTAAILTSDNTYALGDGRRGRAVVEQQIGNAIVESFSNPDAFRTDAKCVYDAVLSLVDVHGVVDCPERWFTYQFPKLRAFDAYVAETRVTPTILVPDELPG